MILHQPIGLQRIDSEMAAEIDGSLVLVLGLLFGGYFLQLALVKPRSQDLHGGIPVAVLRFFVLALHHDSRGQVGYPYRGVRAVDVLAAGAAGPEDVNTQIVFVYGDIDVLARVREHVN